MIKKGKHLEIYNIGTQAEVSIDELVQKLAEYFGRKLVIVPGKLAAGSPSRRCPDISKISQLGYKPHVTLPEGLAKTAQWYWDNTQLYI